MTNQISISEAFPYAIIDDDPFIRDLLTDKMQQYFPEMNLVAIAENGQEGIQKLQQTQPSLVFLDVEMSDMTGFEMLSKLPEIKFKTIFITSYRHYAIKAIRFNALDYLLKPFDLEELRFAIKRFKSEVDTEDFQAPISQALKNMANPNMHEHELVLKTQDSQLKIPVSEIIHIQGDRNYSCIYLTGSRKEVVAKTLSDLEEILNDKLFFRCHKSHLVNRKHIESFPNKFQLKLSSGKIIGVSRRKRLSFGDWLSKSEGR